MQEGEGKQESGDTQLPRDASPRKNPFGGWHLYGFVFEVGYTVAIPLVLFAWGGRYMDKALETSPWFLLAGIVLSIFISSVLIYKKMKTFLH